MPIIGFRQDPDEPFGTGEFTNDQGKSVYTSDPVEARRFVDTMPGTKSLRQEVVEQSAALSPMPDPQGPPIGRLAQNASEEPNMSVDPSQSASDVPTAQSLYSQVNRFNPGPGKTPEQTSQASTPSRRGDGGGVQLVGRTISSTSGRDPRAVQQDIDQSRTILQQRKTDNLAAAQNREDRMTASYAGQRTELQGTVDRRKKDEEEALLDIRRAADQINTATGEKDPILQPNRIIDNMSTGKKIAVAALSGIFGGLAAIGGRQNGFLKAINDNIEQDIRAQELAIENGKVNRANRIAYYRSLGADARQARVLARQDIVEAIKQQNLLTIQENQFKGQELDNATNLNNQLDAEQARWEASLRADATPRTSSSVQYADPSLSRGQGPTYGEAIRTENARRELNNADRVSQVVGREVSASEVKDLQQGAEKIGKEEAELAGAKEQYKTYVQALGGEVNMQTGEVVWPEDDDLTGAGIGGLNPWSAAKDQRDALKEYVTKRLTGASATVKQDKTFTDMVGGTQIREGKVKRNVEAFGRTLWGASEAVRRGNPDAAKYYDYVNGQTRPQNQGTGGMREE